jgi:hypothetical protein
MPDTRRLRPNWQLSSDECGKLSPCTEITFPSPLLGPWDGFNEVMTMSSSYRKENVLREKSMPPFMLISKETTPTIDKRGDKHATLVAEMNSTSALIPEESPNRQASPSAWNPEPNIVTSTPPSTLPREGNI